MPEDHNMSEKNLLSHAPKKAKQWGACYQNIVLFPSVLVFTAPTVQLSDKKSYTKKKPY